MTRDLIPKFFKKNRRAINSGFKPENLIFLFPLSLSSLSHFFLHSLYSPTLTPLGRTSFSLLMLPSCRLCLHSLLEITSVGVQQLPTGRTAPTPTSCSLAEPPPPYSSCSSRSNLGWTTSSTTCKWVSGQPATTWGTIVVSQWSGTSLDNLDRELFPSSFGGWDFNRRPP